MRGWYVRLEHVWMHSCVLWLSPCRGKWLSYDFMWSNSHDQGNSNAVWPVCLSTVCNTHHTTDTVTSLWTSVYAMSMAHWHMWCYGFQAVSAKRSLLTKTIFLHVTSSFWYPYISVLFKISCILRYYTVMYTINQPHASVRGQGKKNIN